MLDLIHALHQAADRRSGAIDPGDGVTGLTRVIASLGEDSVFEGPAETAVAEIAKLFDLSPLEESAVWCLACAGLSPAVLQAYGLLLGRLIPTNPTISLILELLDHPVSSPGTFDLIGRGSRLRRSGLVSIVTATAWLQSEAFLSEAALARIAGSDSPLSSLQAATRDVVAFELPTGERVSRALDRGHHLIWVFAENDELALMTVADGLERRGRTPLVVDLRRAPQGAVIEDLLEEAALAARLYDRNLVLTNLPDRECLRSIRLDIPFVVATAVPWSRDLTLMVPALIDAQAVSRGDRRRIWERILEWTGAPIDAAQVDTLAVSAHQALEAVILARESALIEDSEIDPAALSEASMAITGARALSADLTKDATVTMADLVLNEHTAGAVDRLIARVRLRGSVPFASRRGVAALFAGPPGTGKTLAARAVANHLRMGLLKVDLSMIIDKYIGETEKRLEDLFRSAEGHNVALLFDEADALFGNRSSVSDAKDRYANQGVAYLLQRLESFDGFIILTSNLQGNIDGAFTRRLDFVINFLSPDEPTRAAIWRQHLSHVSELDGAIDVEMLAANCDFAGGDIQNVVVAAACQAMASSENLSQRHLVSALTFEYEKHGRRAPPSLLGPNPGR